MLDKGFSIIPDINVQYKRYGSDYGGWNIVDSLLDENSIIYSAGIGEDISFDKALIEEKDVIIYAFDPTPKSIRWVTKQKLPNNFILHEYGMADFDGFVQFNPPENPKHVSYTILDRPSTEGKAIKVPMKRLSTIMRELDHDSIDLLKMDIEGAEYSVIDDMKTSGIYPKQILVEFHHRFPGVGIKKTMASIETIKRMGYWLFWVSDSKEECGFLRKTSKL